MQTSVTIFSQLCRKAHLLGWNLNWLLCPRLLLSVFAVYMNEIKAVVNCYYFPFTATTNPSPLTLQEVRDDLLLMTSMTQSLCNPGLTSAKIFRPLSSLARESCCSSIHRSIEAGSIALKLWHRSLPKNKQNHFRHVEKAW